MNYSNLVVLVLLPVMRCQMLFGFRRDCISLRDTGFLHPQNNFQYFNLCWRWRGSFTMERIYPKPSLSPAVKNVRQ